MQLSDLLLEKLNSELDTFKKIQLAKNAFLSSDLRIAYKEEHILLWFLNNIKKAMNDNEKEQLIGELHFILRSEVMIMLPASGVRLSAKIKCSKYLNKIFKHANVLDKIFISCVFVILKKFHLHYKSHAKEYIKIMNGLLNQQLSSAQYIELLTLTFDIYKSGTPHEKFVSYLMKKNFHVLFERLEENDEKSGKLVQFLQKMIFQKEFLIQFQNILNLICSDETFDLSNTTVKEFISALHSIYVSDLSSNLKIVIFCKVFQCFSQLCSNEDNPAIFQFFIILCHLIGLEEMVKIHSSEKNDGFKNVVNKDYFQESFDVSILEANETSFIIARLLVEEIGKNSVDLNAFLLDSTYLHWFQSFATAVLGVKEFSNLQLDLLNACINLDTSIIEKNFSKIFNRLLNLPVITYEFDEFSCSYYRFMANALEMYSKLQNVQKFIGKLLQTIKNSESSVTYKYIFPLNFMDQFSNIVTYLPSMQTLSFLDDLLKTLNDNCIVPLENSDSINIVLVQVTSALLSAFMRGIKVLSHSTPRSTFKSFMEKMRILKEMLGRFGRTLLVRIHDREIVQPFLNICFHWGEFQLLVIYYAHDFSEPLVNKDISPNDLSSLHSYLNGEEWNVLTERIFNFGAVQCYQFFLKLMLQKLRMLHLKNCHSLVNGEGTSKLILNHLTSELYSHNIINELVPEDLIFMFGYLSQMQMRLLLEKLYAPVFDERQEIGKLQKWLNDSVLLENQNFILLSLEAILQRICQKIGRAKRQDTMLKEVCNVLTLEFIDGNYNINQENVVKIVKILNETLSHANSLDNIKITPIKICIEIMNSLPIVHMPNEICSMMLTILTFLAVIFSKFEDLLKPLMLLIYGLVRKMSKKNLSSSFNLSLCIKWLLCVRGMSEDIRYCSGPIVKSLLKSATNSEKDLMELKQLIRLVRKAKDRNNSANLENQILLYQDLGTSWIKSRKRKSENGLITKYRKRLAKSISSELKNRDLENAATDNDTLFFAYGIALARAVKLKKEMEITNLFGLNFEKFLNFAITKLSDGSEEEGCFSFVSTLLIHLPNLRPHVGRNIMKKIWKALKSNPRINCALFYHVATPEEFRFFMFDLLKTWKRFSEKQKENIDLRTYFRIWKEFCSCEIKNNKDEYAKYLKRLFFRFSASLTFLNGLKSREVIYLFDFLHFCTSTPEIFMTSRMLDASFDIMISHEYEESLTSKEFQGVFESCVIAASWILTRSSRMRDKIHNIFQLFTKLLNELVKRSSVALKLTDNDLLALSSCSFNMEKWTAKIIKWDKDFARVAVYFIGEIISSFIKFNIYPVIKTSLTNCINNFLSISDSHNVAYLERVLEPGSRQIFNGIYESYQKYYKYTGKI